MANEKVTLIQDLAENYIRIGGYKAFSFREIAKHVGIKSASIHYHFPSKQDLAVAVAERYTQRFLTQLTAIETSYVSKQERVAAYIACFRGALLNDGKMCLCGALAAESNDLPEPVRATAKIFFEKNVTWLEAVLATKDNPQPTSEALRCIALLEGAMLMSQAYQDHAIFERIVADFPV